MSPVHRNPLSAFILAGGASRRMGRDKALLQWGNQTLVEHMSQRFASVADSVRVVGRDPFPDRVRGRGPVEGIATALANTKTIHNLIVAVDLPFLDDAFIRYLALRQQTTSRNLLVCETGGSVPLCVGAQPGLLPFADAYLASGRRSFQEFVHSVEHETIDRDALRVNGIVAKIFENINTPEDYERLHPLADGS